MNTDQWTILESKLNQPREGVSCGVLGDTIYAIGGFDGKVSSFFSKKISELYFSKLYFFKNYLQSVEYMREDGKWEIGGDLIRGRSSPRSGVDIENNFFV